MTIAPISLRVSMNVALRKAQTVIEPTAYRFAWDDEISSYNFKCRTQMPGWSGPDNPPAVLRYFPSMSESGDYRVNLEKDPSWKWWETFTILNGGDESDVEYIAGPSRAQFNTTGWPQMAYVGMCGNRINVLDRVGDWVKFETMRPDDWFVIRNKQFLNRDCYVHHFTCVTFKDGKTVHIDSTGTNRGSVFYPLVTNEGYTWIPSRFVVEA